MKLNDVAVRKAKPDTRSYKMSDGGGMYLEVMPNAQNTGGLSIVLGARKNVSHLVFIPTCP